LTEAAKITGNTKAAVRRSLLTLCKLGYAMQSGRQYRLAPRSLRLGHADISDKSPMLPLEQMPTKSRSKRGVFWVEAGSRKVRRSLRFRLKPAWRGSQGFPSQKGSRPRIGNLVGRMDRLSKFEPIGVTEFENRPIRVTGFRYNCPES
jgi:hypothetical protein